MKEQLSFIIIRRYAAEDIELCSIAAEKKLASYFITPYDLTCFRFCSKTDFFIECYIL